MEIYTGIISFTGMLRLERSPVIYDMQITTVKLSKSLEYTDNNAYQLTMYTQQRITLGKRRCDLLVISVLAIMRAPDLIIQRASPPIIQRA